MGEYDFSSDSSVEERERDRDRDREREKDDECETEIGLFLQKEAPTAETIPFGRNKLFRQNNRKVVKSQKHLLPYIRPNNGRNYTADTLYGRSLELGYSRFMKCDLIQYLHI